MDTRHKRDKSQISIPDINCHILAKSDQVLWSCQLSGKW
jgi:hypothetical protein